MSSVSKQSGKASSTLLGVITGIVIEHIVIITGIAVLTLGITKGNFGMNSIGGFIVGTFLIASFCGCMAAISKTKRRYIYIGGILFAASCCIITLWGVLFFHGHITDMLPVFCLFGTGTGIAVILSSLLMTRNEVRKKRYKMVKMNKNIR